jgi:flagellar biosynthesis/type III secretory pathway M-ring protein FliF/YscJ
MRNTQIKIYILKGCTIMELNEMNNIEVAEEVIETVAEEITVPETGKGLKVAVVAGVALLVGGIVYKKVVKPLIAKRKAKKAQVEEEQLEIEDICTDDEE